MHYDEDFSLALQLQEQFINEVNVKEVRIFGFFVVALIPRKYILVANVRYCTYAHKKQFMKEYLTFA
jgi:hypothetical protein